MKSISIFLNKEGNTAAPNEEGIVKVYTYNDTSNSWSITNEIDFSLLKTTSIISLRSTISEMIESLGDCKVFVAKEVVGQLFSVLEANGFNIYEAEGKPEQFLESIFASEIEESKRALNVDQESVIPHPIETETKGKYFIDLKEVLSSYPDLSSKKVLLPFLSSRNFKALEIICGHVPKWFDYEFKLKGFQYDISKLEDNKYKVVISAW